LYITKSARKICTTATSRKYAPF